ncbi:hypothetical protein Herbaro_15315 [Herbaspirillum sp. WKF16]|uniref:hypothetical protein n=1 Tax=Herbaspirillum sp. WKF16 TaxID=3028312 RepID=UPI0023A94684|nr:hypothetical protein [Herbaspirillum sp. WKF16]WDZ94848.1 hypothetical protein Herbaro_15315 [Herbaspirillum sp. WKF16]
MPRKSKLANAQDPDFVTQPDGFINVPVSKKTREDLHALKKSMQVASQAEVIEKAVAIARAIDIAVRN